MRRIFWGFCRNLFLIDLLHYLSSRFDFGFEFAEIFIIEKRLPDSASRGVVDSPTRRVGESAFECLNESSASRRVGDSLTRLVGKSLTPRVGKSESRRLPGSASRGVVFRLRSSPRIRSQNRNGSKCTVKDLCRTDLCKNPRKSASLPCPFNYSEDRQRISL
jgi:hypothetical protein